MLHKMKYLVPGYTDAFFDFVRTVGMAAAS